MIEFSTIQKMKKEGIRTAYNELRKVKNAAIAVATGPTGLSPEQVHVKQYVDAYSTRVRRDEDLHNPGEIDVARGLGNRIIGLIAQGQFNPHDWAKMEKAPQQIVRMDRTAATVISFSDDHNNEIAEEFFPVDNMLQFLHDVRVHYQCTGKRANLLDQFNIALTHSNNNPVEAALLAHGAYRAVGRVLDTRVSDRLHFPVYSETDEISMVNIAESTAHFTENADHVDPTGDTYHWWGQFAAGMIFELYKTDKPVQSRMYSGAFYYGPNLMKFARETIMRKKMISGSHQEVDRQGLRLGKAIGYMIAASTAE